MSTTWSIFVIILVVANVGGCLWLIRWSMHMKSDAQKPGEMSTGHTWDGDLEELNNPLPRWWLNTFYISIAFSVVYLVLYPGFGNFSGVLNWSQTGQYDSEVAASNAKFGEVYAAFRGRDVEALASDPDAVRLGQNTYVNVCAACHGADARGAKGFPNLTDDAWLYGGDGVNVLNSIKNGRNGVMPALGAVVGQDGADLIATYLLSPAGDTSADVAAGKQKYLSSGCIGCHGMNAEGNTLVGGPNLRDSVWLHGGSREEIVDIIMNGRVNQMPAQLPIIGEDRARLVAAYVLSLSR
jgi:cytochrome c oxidase cbb3-type subunit 3